nr:uncharacterized protein LOC112545966 [Pelodiscus sinensis]|eukprot:XP_025040896.1 uncharacterized protein LOC112545966 [Pelodiscus sinensis]
MLLLKAFVLSMVFSYGSSQVKLTQPQQSMTREESKTIRIDCRVSVRNFDQAYIHWYKQRPGAAPERILYISTQAAFDRASDKGKFNAEKKKIGQPTCTLIIDKTSFSDTATYYCAYWDHTVLENSTPPVQKSTLLFKTQVCQYGAAQEQLTQTQISITKIPKKTVKMDYKIFGIDVGGAYIHWYGQRPGEAPEWLLYYKTQNDQSNFDKDKFSIDKTS